MRHKREVVDLHALTVGALLRRRRRLARTLQNWEATLQGTLVTQGRRCGKTGCRCAQGELHGPYVYVALAHPRGSSRLLYVPEEVRELVRQKIAMTDRMTAALEAISEINLELLARRALE